MSSASEEKRKIEEEINQKLNELNKIENKENAEKSTRIKKFAKEGFFVNLIITVIALASLALIDWDSTKSGLVKTFLLITIVVSFICVIIDFVAFGVKREDKLSDFFTGLIIFINIPAFLLAIISIIFIVSNSDVIFM